MSAETVTRERRFRMMGRRSLSDRPRRRREKQQLNKRKKGGRKARGEEKASTPTPISSPCHAMPIMPAKPACHVACMHAVLRHAMPRQRCYVEFRIYVPVHRAEGTKPSPHDASSACTQGAGESRQQCQCVCETEIPLSQSPFTNILKAVAQ